MLDFKKQPYNLLLLTAILILIASFFVHNQALDMHLHDTYFIISLSHLFWTIILFLLLFWILYLLTRHILFSKLLIWVHVLLLVLTSLSLMAILFYSIHQGIAGSPRRYYDFSNWEATEQIPVLITGIVMLFIAVILGLFMYIINLTMGVIKRFTGRRNSR